MSFVKASVNVSDPSVFGTTEGTKDVDSVLGIPKLIDLITVRGEELLHERKGFSRGQ